MVLGLSTGLQKRIRPPSKRCSWPFGVSLGQLSTGTIKVPKVDQKQAEMETDRLGAREAPRQRAEARERERRTVLVVEPDRRRRQGLRIVRRQPGGPAELTFPPDRPQRLLVGGAAQEVRLDRAGCTDETRDE